MNHFKDFNIKVERETFTGDKVKISKILNKEITVFKFKIGNSKFDGMCLHLQIGIGDNKHVAFTGSVVLMDAIQKVPPSAFPFKTTIVENSDNTYEFT